MSDVNTIEIEETKKYELRGLKATDLGHICKIISTIGIREFKSCFENKELKKVIASGKIDTKSIGFGIMFDLAGIIISNIPKAEKEIQMFVASVAGMKVSELQEVPFAEYGEMIIAICMKEDFKDFFGRAIKLFK